MTTPSESLHGKEQGTLQRKQLHSERDFFSASVTSKVTSAEAYEIRKKAVNNYHDTRVPSILPFLSQALKSLLKGTGKTAAVQDASRTKLAEQVKDTDISEALRWERLSRNVFETVDSESMTKFEWLKAVLGLVFLFLPRLLCFLLLSTMYLAFNILVVAIFQVDTSKPLPPTVQMLQYYSTRVYSTSLMIVLGVLVKTKGTLSTLEESSIQLLCPHSTWLDPLVLFYSNSAVAVSSSKQASKTGFFEAFAERGNLSFVGKKEVLETPLQQQLLSWSQPILVDRDNSKSKQKTLSRIKEVAVNHDAWKRRIVISPEGTCGNRTKVMRFSSGGAFRVGLPSQPVLLRWDNELCWTNGSKNRAWIFLRSFCELFHSVELEYLPVYVPNEEEKVDPVVYANNVRNLCAKELALETSEASFVDRKLARLCAKAKLNPSDVMTFCYQDLVDALGSHANEIDVKKELEQMLRAFLKCCDKATGGMSAEQFTAFRRLHEQKQQSSKVGAEMTSEQFTWEEIVAAEAKARAEQASGETGKDGPLSDALFFRQIVSAYFQLRCSFK